MLLKFDDNGAPVVVEKDGVHLPVFVDADGTEIEVNVPNLYNKITELNTEAKTYRKDKAALKDTLKIFEGIEDLGVWKTNAEKALETVKNFNDKQLVDAGKVDEIKQQMKVAHEEDKAQLHESYKNKIGEYEGQLTNKDGIIYNLMVSSKFAQSPFFSGPDPRTNLPADVAESYFGRQFKVEDNGKGGLRVTGYRKNGHPIYSKRDPGELAEFEEALEVVINESPHKDTIMRTTGGGSGSSGGEGSSRHLKGIDAKIARLKELREEAVKNKDGKLAIHYKNQIFDLETRKKKGEN